MPPEHYTLREKEDAKEKGYSNIKARKGCTPTPFNHVGEQVRKKT